LESAARFLDLGFADNDGNHFLSSYVLERRTCKALFHILTFLSTAVSEILKAVKYLFEIQVQRHGKGVHVNYA